jgi:hypothetical protein
MTIEAPLGPDRQVFVSPDQMNTPAMPPAG